MTSWTADTPILDGRTQVSGVGNPQDLLAGTSNPEDLTEEERMAAQLAADAEALFPTWDADTPIATRPAGWSATPSPEVFATWHTAHQILWLTENGTEVTIDPDGDAATDNSVTTWRATIGTSTDALSNLHVVVVDDGQGVLILNHADPVAVAKLSLVDQLAVAGHPAFADTIAAVHGVRPATGETVEDARDAAAEPIETLRTAVVDAFRDANSGLSAAEAETRLATFLTDPSVRAADWHLAFVAQADILLAQLDAMAVFSIDAIELAVAELAERFERMQRFERAAQTPESGTYPAISGMNALDGGAKLASGFETFLRIELTLYDLAAASRQVSLTSAYEDRVLDAPGLTFVLQTFANYRTEADAEAKTEELDQRNALLQDYAVMQEIVANTLAQFAQNSEDSALTTVSVLVSTESERRALMMFDPSLSPSGSAGHPSEQQVALTRPTLLLLLPGTESGVNYTKEYWDTFAIELSEATRQLSRDNEILMNEIGQINREKNRHFDLASSTLNKMTSILRSIIN